MPPIDGLAVKSRFVMELVILGDMCPQAARFDAAASSDGTLTRVGSVTVPGAVGGEGIVAG